MSSPTQRTLALLREELYIAQVVEKWVPQARRRIDLFGIIDIVAIKPKVILGIQATTTSNASSHVTKALAEPRLLQWLLAGGGFELWDWRKVGPRGKMKRWAVRQTRFYLTDSIKEPIAYGLIS